MNVLEALRFYKKECVAIIITSDKCYDNIEQSEGYLEIRNLNQSIIIKRGEHESPTSARGIGDTIILGSSVEGGTFADCAAAGEYWLDLYPMDGANFECGIEIPEFLVEGFTITPYCVELVAL